MTIYRAQEMNKLANSKSKFEKEKEKAMEEIYKAASCGEFQTCFLIGDFTDYRLVIAWLVDLGYRCVHIRNDNRFYVKWEKKI